MTVDAVANCPVTAGAHPVPGQGRRVSLDHPAGRLATLGQALAAELTEVATLLPSP